MRLLDELRRRWWLLPLVVVVLALVFGTRLATFYTDVLWYSSVGFLDVFSTRLLTSIGLALAAGLGVAALVGGNLLLARRLTPPFRIPSPQEEAIERYRELIEPFVRSLLLVVAAVVGALSALSVAGEWDTFLLWANAVDFGRDDPQFGLDLGFFVFRLPFWSFVNSWLFTVLAFAIVLTAVAHYVFGGIRPQSPGQKVSPQAAAHLSVLLAALVAVRGWGFWLDRYQLSYSERGVITGLSYTDVNAELRAYTLLTIIAGVCVLLFLANLYYRNFLLPTAGVGILLVAAIVLSGLYPAAIQRFQVAPQELAREEPYIQRNLDMTRFGYGVEDVAREDFPAEPELSEQDAAANSDTLASIRLWDPSVLSGVYAQVQALRQYFEFPDLDIDRYDIDGRQRQVNIAVRELQVTDLPDDSWQNQHLVYTHGHGVVATAVSDKTPNGQPVLLAQDIPQTGDEVFDLDQPRVYFGQRSPEYSVVGTDQPELDYTEGEEGEASFSYDGRDGVQIGGLLRRLAFAVRYAEPNLLLSNLLTPDSRILFNRQIEQRVSAVAPFLQLDGDPYAVAVDGRVQWVIDAYTTTDMLPYSDRRDLGSLTTVAQTQLVEVEGDDGGLRFEERVRPVQGLEGAANYVRNSVKVVVDGYDGTVRLFVVDPEDPVIRAWTAIFPDAFTDQGELSDGLRQHFRYPEDLFRVQADVFTQYHVADPATFYSRQDLWDIPADAAAIENLGSAPAEGQEPRLRPYYLQTRLPGEDAEEFALVQPFNPANRDNLTAWMAARSDPGQYGELRVYEMPDNSSVRGNRQVQAQINQDATVSQQITLLGDVGSRIRYGNLITIPVAGALLHAQPLYVLAEQGSVPELRYVVLVLGEQVVLEQTLQEALTSLLGDAAPTDTPTDDGGDQGPPVSVDERVADLIQRALEAFTRAEQALAEGDLGGYQEATQEAQRLLEEARGLTGPPADEPAG